MHALDSASSLWRTDAERLLRSITTARAANSVELWRDKIAVEAYRGREQAISDMTHYTCGLTLRYLRAVLADEAKLTPQYLRENYLDPVDGNELGATVSMNAMQIATFFLVGPCDALVQGAAGGLAAGDGSDVRQAGTGDVRRDVDEQLGMPHHPAGL